MDKVAQLGKSFLGFTFQQSVQRFGAEGARKFLDPLDTGNHRLHVFTSQSHVIFLSAPSGSVSSARLTRRCPRPAAVCSHRPQDDERLAIASEINAFAHNIGRAELPDSKRRM